jgi:hypothetical protein
MNRNGLILYGLIAFALCVAPMSVYAHSHEIMSIDLAGGDTVDIRRYSADGDKLLLGIPCDEGTGEAAMNAADVLSDTSMEIWMPDLLSAHFLPNLKSALAEIPTEDVVTLIDAAIASSDKQLFLISSGQCSTVLMRGLVAWEEKNSNRLGEINGMILLYPRLNARPPEPGKDPVYIDAVGKTRTAIAILEGEKTPNRWALPALKEQMQAGGSLVTVALIPGVRGFFYERDKQSLPEDIVTSQLASLVRASVIKLEMLIQRESHTVN